jgi:sulfoxide reductase heme-binding subunit YedZ
MTKSSGKQPLIQIATHVGALIPLAILIYDYFTNNLTFNPIQEATLRTGKTALVLLVLSLACTPIYTVFKWRPAINIRRPLGVYTTVYVIIHLLIFVWLDYGLVWTYIYEAIFEKRFALVGFAAFLILLPMAITSTKGWQKRLGKRWKSLHKWVYLAGVLAVIHYVWLVKSDIREPLVYGAIVGILLILRIPAVKKKVSGSFKGISFPFGQRRQKNTPAASE